MTADARSDNLPAGFPLPLGEGQGEGSRRHHPTTFSRTTNGPTCPHGAANLARAPSRSRVSPRSPVSGCSHSHVTSTGRSAVPGSVTVAFPPVSLNTRNSAPASTALPIHHTPRALFAGEIP